MSHQKRVSQASAEYRLAKSRAKSRAKEEGLKAYKAAYDAVYDQEMERASIDYGRALRKKDKYTPITAESIDDLISTMEPDEDDATEDLSKLTYVELMQLYQDGKITAEQAQAANSKHH